MIKLKTNLDTPLAKSVGNTNLQNIQVAPILEKQDSLAEELTQATKAQDWKRVGELAGTIQKLQNHVDAINAPTSSGEVKGFLKPATPMNQPLLTSISSKTQNEIGRLQEKATQAAGSADWEAFVKLNQEIEDLRKPSN